MNMRTRLVMLVAVSALTTGATCGGEPSPDQASAAANAASTTTDGCPLPADVVTRILGRPVHLTRSPVRLMDACSYQLDEDSTVEVELSIKPSSVGDMLFAGLHERVKARLGSDARAETIAVGEEGWAYASASGSEAAVRKGEKVYHAVIASPSGDSAPRLKDEMIRLVAAMINGPES